MESNTFDLSGRTIVITGASKGIGLALAKGLAESNAQLSLWSRGEPPEAALRLQDLTNAQFLQCDVSNEPEVTSALAATASRFGVVHGCIANAGISGSNTPSSKLLASTWHRVLATNLDGCFYTLRAVAAHMIESGVPHGRLLAISSLAASIGAPNHTEYAASKAAVGGVVRSLAAELGQYGITVNALAPGWIETEMNDEIMRDRRRYEGIRQLRIPLKRWGKPVDLVGVTRYLMSCDSSYHTGDTLTIDGGYRIF